MSTAEVPLQVSSARLHPPLQSRRERTHGQISVVPSQSWLVAALLSASSAPAGHFRRNAVGPVGVKLGAAPDAPPWGKVLVRTASDRFPSARTRAASKFTCLSREHPVCSALVTDPGETGPDGPQPRAGRPASSGGGRRRGRQAGQPTAGTRMAQQLPAWAMGQAERAADAAITTRQRASHDRTRGRDPHPGKDPL